MAASERTRVLRQMCIDVYDRNNSVIDPDFIEKFRRNTPEHFSELFFANAMHIAGFVSTGRVKGVDFAYKIPGYEGRLFIEVVTPSITDWTGVVKQEIDGLTFTSMDGRARQASLLRLTSAFYRKAESFESSICSGHVSEKDIKIIAISGIKINQEGGWAPEHFGNPPSFSEAFLPIGQMYVPINLSAGAAMFGSASFSYSNKIDRGQASPVERDAFVSGKFSHIDAVAYSEINLSYAERSADQIGVLYNPTSLNAGKISSIGMSADYHVAISSHDFSITRHIREDLSDLKL